MTEQNTIIGCDPELVWRMSSSGADYSGMLPAGMVLRRLKKIGSELITGEYKGYPCIETSNGLIFADGAGWELNPMPGTRSELTDNIRGLLATSVQVEKELTTYKKPIELQIRSAVAFNLQMLELWQDEQLAIFGCDEDESIWPRDITPGDINAAEHPYRYFGGHIHIGYPAENSGEFYADMNNIRRMVALADGFLGMAGLCADHHAADWGQKRRKVYGQPGVYRLQPHGIEYRTISNSWLLTPQFVEWMLTLSTYLPALLETDIPEYILGEGRVVRDTLIGGKLSRTVSFLETLEGIVIDASWTELKDTLGDIIREGRRALNYQASYPVWKIRWNL